MVGQLVIFYLVNSCKILISKTTKELFCDQIPYCYFTSFFFTKMEPINFESIFGMMANDPEKAQHEAKPVTYALNTSK